MLLMIDNYDSFTYNLVQYFGELGEAVEVFRNDEITLERIKALNAQRIVISPGPCTPNEAGVSLSLLKEYGGQVPTLGVFRAPEHWASIRWKNCARQADHAWKNVTDIPSQYGCISRSPQSIYCDPLSFPGD